MTDEQKLEILKLICAKISLGQGNSEKNLMR